MATSRPSLVSRAGYTSPIPPSPIWATTSYVPSLVPAASVIGRVGLVHSIKDPMSNELRASLKLAQDLPQPGT
jgi:hypothetical protein